jgi:hypothetical protein
VKNTCFLRTIFEISYESTSNNEMYTLALKAVIYIF